MQYLFRQRLKDKRPCIDALFIGPYDLSASMGLTGRVDDPAVVAAMATVRSRAAEAGMPVGVFVAATADARPYIADGYGLVAVSTDMMMLADAARQIVKTVKK